MTEIVIKIPDKVYDYVSREWVKSDFDSPLNHVMNGVKNGKVLPEGHGALQDQATIVNNIIKTNIYLTDNDWHELMKAIRNADTLIEADRETSPKAKRIDGLIEKVIRIASAPSESADTYIDAQLILYKLLGEALLDKTVRKPISKALYETWRTLNASERDRLEERT